MDNPNTPDQHDHSAPVPPPATTENVRHFAVAAIAKRQPSAPLVLLPGQTAQPAGLEMSQCAILIALARDAPDSAIRAAAEHATLAVFPAADGWDHHIYAVTGDATFYTWEAPADGQAVTLPPADGLM